MECLLTFLVLLVMFTVATGWAARAQSRRGRRQRTYQQLAKRFAGRNVSAGLFGRPSVRFRYGDTHALVTESSARGPYRGRCTQVQIDWPDPRFRCEVYRDRGGQRALTFRSMRDIAVGDEQFDRDFVIRGDDQRDVEHFLSDGVRWQIDRLRRLFDDGDVYILVSRGRLFVQTPQLIWRFEKLTQFVETALQLYDQAMLTRASGIEFVESDEAQTLASVVCRVCGEEICHDMIYCRRCKTPHHRECWHYNGACCVFGCRETVYLTPQAAEPVSRPHASHKHVEP